eukprot:CAMPEP_0119354272 /NCGR_PEP_ID=MMETSP1334-20130426/3286_1 /TAXON_ID=127549 /ORGANISM="Calcidiscus leptoporus, Strain RCC1130" /LENGTH=77 /DNA_ID=CAMNT_0007367777 /DNA_START=57 /DNA_END=287 /DNA_ORIENTATION=+
MSFPAHWGQPPLAQTRDLVELPGGYGRGSGTLARWIEEKMTQDADEDTAVEWSESYAPAPGVRLGGAISLLRDAISL